jgi:biotin transport system substrate-specific component
MVTNMSWIKTFMVGMAPFLIGDGVKASVALMLARAVRPVLNRQLQMEKTYLTAETQTKTMDDEP